MLIGLSVTVMTIHFYWLIYRSHLSDIYMLGSAVIAAGSSAMFDRVRNYAFYSAVTFAMLFTITVIFRDNTKSTMFLVMIVTIHAVATMSISARARAILHLKEARELNLEMRRQLLEKELDEVREESAQLRKISLQDSVTGLPNRYYLERQIHFAFDRYFQEKTPFVLMFIDLDRFKAVNDTYGHIVGDQVLALAAKRIRESIRRSDIVARQGGDEFVALLSGVDDDIFIERIRAAIVAAVSEQMVLSDRVKCSIGASIGVALCPRHATEFRALMDAADNRMYEVKRAGKAGR